MARLGDRAERSLSIAAVIGRRFDFDLLTRSTRFPEDEVLEILEAATAAALVREVAGPPGHYTFAHALIRHTIYESLGPTRRSRAHKQVAEALEDICGGHPGPRVGELARQWLNASGGSASGRAIRYARQAGDAALSALAPADALRYFTQANELLEQVDDPDPVLALDLVIGLGTAQRQTGDPAFRDTLLEAAHRAAEFGDTERLVAAALANNRGFYSAIGTTDSQKVEVLEAALNDLPARSPERALVLATLCSELAHGSPLELRQGLAEEAESIANQSGDDTTCVRVLNHLYIPLQVPSAPGSGADPNRRRARPRRAPRRPRTSLLGRHVALPDGCPLRRHRRVGPLPRDPRGDGGAARAARVRLGTHVSQGTAGFHRRGHGPS